MSYNDNRNLAKPKMVRSRCLRLWWNSYQDRTKEKGMCQTLHQRLLGRVEEEHQHHHDTEQQELQAEAGEGTPIMREKDLVGSQMRVGKEDGTRDQHPSQKKMTMTSRTMNALGHRTRVPAEPPPMFRNETHQDIRMWLMTCTDDFGRNSWQWEDEAQRIRYAISRMDGKEVAPFALTYRRQMTREIGYTRQEGYEFWHVFAQQVLRRFEPTHEAEKSLREMGSVKYLGDVAKFLMEMANLNIHARVTGIAGRKMIEDELPIEALRRLSHREYVYDGEWLEAVRTVTRAEEDFKERKDLRGGGPCGTTRGEKRKFDDSKPTVAAKSVKKQYTATEKAAYQKKKAGERKVKKEGSVATKGEVRHTLW